MGDEQRNLEVVTRLAELWNVGDLEGLLALYDEDVEVVTDPGWPEGSTRGKDAFARSSREWREAWEKIDATAAEMHVIGSDRVLAEGTWDSRGAASGVPGRMEFAILYTLRDGLVVRQQWFLDQSAGRRAAGLG